jgi:signal transduction histidine kinase
MFSLVFIVIYSEIFQIDSFWSEIALLLATVCAIIFAIGFYEGRFIPKIESQKELIISAIFLNIVISTSFYHYILFEYLPYTLIYAILFTSIVFNLKLRSKPIMMYVFGWSLLCLLLFVFDFKHFYINQGFVDIVLLSFAIEAVLFTLSVSYHYAFLQRQTKEYEEMLIQQSKLAKSGEMINNITHQFRQPLNNLSYILINIKKRYTNKKLDEVYFDKKFDQASEQIQFLSKTIDDFREFYTHSKSKSIFSIVDAINNAITVLSAETKQKSIKIVLNINNNDDIAVYGIKSELSQVIVSLLSNATEALDEIQDATITINIYSNPKEAIIKVSDNGKGIKKRDIKRVFEPYFSTKESGTGIGLYLAKMIIEDSFGGVIGLVSSKEGTDFTLFLKKATNEGHFEDR